MNKEQNKRKIDIEAILFMYILHLKEEKKKKYSSEECEKNIVYLFDNYDEFKSYFEFISYDSVYSKIRFSLDEVRDPGQS